MEKLGETPKEMFARLHVPDSGVDGYLKLKRD
jgi:hypothetical protein